MDITPNIVTCPHCENQFIHNRVNGVALLDIVQNVQTKTRVHSRLTLDTLERFYGSGEIPRAVRKAILDGYSDLARDVQTILGFGVEAE